MNDAIKNNAEIIQSYESNSGNQTLATEYQEESARMDAQVTELYIEYRNLNNLDGLDQICQEIKDDIGSFIDLYRLTKAAGMGIQHIVKLLEIANNHLPSVEFRYEKGKKEAATLEFDKANSVREFQQLNNQHVYV